MCSLLLPRWGCQNSVAERQRQSEIEGGRDVIAPGPDQGPCGELWNVADG